ncbi:MAG: hypothetical protein HRT68_15390, partial [Flavobacteriaceae bacterium]|nr:hypothetical protein [Flavobacteriaceae bacterium]
MKYFGAIENKDFIESWDLKQKERFLIENDFFVKRMMLQKKATLEQMKRKKDFEGGMIFSLNMSANDRKEFLQASEDLSIDFYSFLLNHYSKIIENHNGNFRYQFNEEAYGLSRVEQSKIALNYFKRFYDQIMIPGYDLISNKGLLDETGRIVRLFNLRKSNIQKIAKDIDLITPYLIGDRKFYNRERIGCFKSLLDFIEFESIIHSIILLNKEYQFEEDHFFDVNDRIKTIYTNYVHLFQNDKVLEFVVDCIEQLED